MKTKFRFENLTVWQEARRLNRKVYAVSRSFPTDEQYVLTAQLRRASISVSSNIAEGSGRNSDKDFAHFLELAYASLMEVASQLFLALDQEYISEQILAELHEEIKGEAAQIAALNRSLAVNSAKVRAKKTR